MKRLYAVMVACGAAIVLSACATAPTTQYERGARLVQDDLAFIKKGITSRSEVEARLGAPDAATLGSDGKRIATYQHYRVVSPTFAWGFGTTQMKMSQSSLQIVYSAANTVEDYEFTSSDKAYEVSRFGGAKEIPKK